jgi:hypothetical protein
VRLAKIEKINKAKSWNFEKINNYQIFSYNKKKEKIIHIIKSELEEMLKLIWQKYKG